MSMQCLYYRLGYTCKHKLVLQLFVGYNADIICLQEVDRKLFINDLEPVLSLEGFSGVLKLKAGLTPEGTATFFRQSKFRFYLSRLNKYNESVVIL